MKNTAKILLFHTILLLIAGNVKSDPSCMSGFSSLSPFPSGGGTQTVNLVVIGYDCDWQVVSDLQWVSVTPTQGVGNATITVSCPNYTGFEDRNLTVVFEDIEGGQKQFTVYQEGLAPEDPNSCTEPPLTPEGVISGPSSGCQGTTATYSIDPQAPYVNADYFWWEVPSGTQIISGQETRSIQVTLGSFSGTVRVKAVNQCGSSPYLSKSIAIIEPVGISSHPVGMIKCEDASTTFSINAFGSISGYQWWYTDPGGVATISTESGAQSSLITTFSNIDGRQYHCVVNAVCGSDVSSNAATLTVKQKPVIIKQPDNSTVCVGQTFSFDIIASGDNITYQWYDGNGNEATLPGSNSSAITKQVSVIGDDGTQYRCMVDNEWCSSVYSNFGTVTINPKPDVNVQADNVYILNTESAELTATGASTYIWTPSNGLSTTTGSVVTAGPIETTEYTITGTSTEGCTNTVTVTVNLIEMMSGKINISGTELTVIPSGGEPPYTYLWSTGATTENITVSAPNTYTVTITDYRGESITRAYNYTGSSTTSNSSENIYKKNWVHTKVFNEDGTLIGESRTFSDYLGDAVQSQSKNFTDNKTMVIQTIYDKLGRAAVTTLPAPVDNTNYAYKTGFVANNNGDDYSYLDFDGENGGKLIDPEPVNNAIPNTLGSYYSDNNFAEPYVPATEYPYSRVEYSKTNPGQTRKSSGPGEAHKMGSGHETMGFSMPASDSELGDFLTSIPEIENKGIIKTIVVGVDGKEAISYSTTDQRAIASCLGGGLNSRDVTTEIKAEIGYVDIHIPKDQDNLGATYSISVSEATFEVTDLSNDNDLGQVNTLPAGFYRIKTGIVGTVTYPINYYNFAISVYDKGGRVTKSYSPKSIEDSLYDNMAATFKYNSLGWLLESVDPDAGISHFVYRNDGSIRFSQNEQQEIEGKLSYTNYDDAGRIAEVGEYSSCPGCIVFETYEEYEASGNALSVHKILEDNYSDTNPLADGLDDAYCDYQSFTSYDMPDEGFVLSGYEQNFLLGKVSKTWNNNSTTWYSYLYDGKVDWVVQEIDITGEASPFGTTTIDYAYDAAGNVTTVVYEKDNYAERFDHVYTYDADNRLKEVTTLEYDTLGSIISTKLQAEYFYYQHGPLKRVELADGSQGIDYVYNINGWLKSINHPDLTENSDPGKDGHAYSAIPEDIFGMSLDYYSGDYSRAGTNITSAGDLYNGNIHTQRWQTRADEAPALPTETSQWATQYSYDKRNWLTEALFGTISSAGTSFTADANEAYKVSGLTYDANGNLISLNRNAIDLTVEGTTSTRDMDQFEYKYYGTKNQMRQLIDNNNESSDLDDIKPGQEEYNYEYDSIGQMVVNKQEGHYFEYDVYGKVTAVYEDVDHDYLIAYYDYNEAGFRIKKKDVKNDKETWYIRDASGSILSIYESEAGVPIEQKELPVYAASRVGVAYKNGGSIEKFNYELTDHLGNVRATFQNRVTALDNYITLNGLLTEDEFLEAGESIELTDGFDSEGFDFDASIDPPVAMGDPPRLVQYSDYYPFGMVMPGRNYVSNKYRFGYQGQFAEKDEETGYNQFEARLWDARVGRWLSTDPAGQFYSPYLGMGNNPVNALDPDGEWVFSIQAEGRIAVPLFGGYAGFTASFSRGLMFDDNFNVALFDTYTLGGSVGGVATIGVGVSFLPNADKIFDLKGGGANLGIAIGSGQSFGAEFNFVFPHQTPKLPEILTTKYPMGGTVTLWGAGAGGAAYAEGSYTRFIESFNLKDMINGGVEKAMELFVEELSKLSIELSEENLKLVKENFNNVQNALNE